MVEKIKISINILPFGHMKLMYLLTGEKFEEKEMPIYVEPRSTNIEKVEVLYEGGEKYIVPKTTGGV